MENNIKKKFLNLKLQIIQTLNVKEETIVVNRNIFDQVLRSIWGCSILNNYKNQNISLFTRREFSFTNNIYRNFGIKKIKYVSVKTLLITHLLRSLIFITNSFFLYLYFSMKGIDFFIKDFKVNGIEPGLLIHESYIKKFKHYVDKRTLLPKFYFFKILSAKVLINYLDDYIKKNRIKNIIIGKKEYFGLDSLFFLIAKKKGIKLTILSQEKILQDKSITFNEKFYNFSRSEIMKKISSKKINNYVKKKFAGFTDKDAKYAHGKNIKYKDFNPESFFDEKKKCILFCPHLFSDSMSAAGKFPFRDFFHFYHETLNFISKIKQINWIIKMHPSITLYNEEKIFQKFYRKIVSKNIIILPKNISFVSVIKEVDAVVTGRGSIILEATIHGKKVLAFKKNRFDRTNIFLKYSNRKDYFRKLKFKNTNLNVSKKDIELSKKLLYLYSLKAYKTEDNLLEDIRLKNLKKQKVYYLNLYKKLKKGEKIIYNSIYFKKLKKALLNENNRKDIN